MRTRIKGVGQASESAHLEERRVWRVARARGVRSSARARSARRRQAAAINFVMLAVPGFISRAELHMCLSVSVIWKRRWQE